MACSHHRAPDYFAESIRSLSGFWGWKCNSYIYYLLGFCPHNNYQVMAGEDCIPGTEGMYMVTTNSDSPFAIGRWTDTVGLQKKDHVLNKFGLNRDPFISDIDQWGKLDSNFNNAEHFPTPYSQDPNNANDDDWPYFNHIGTNKLTKEYIKQILEQNKNRYGDSVEVTQYDSTPSGFSNDVDQNKNSLNDLRRRLQLKEASIMEHYTLPIYNAQ